MHRHSLLLLLVAASSSLHGRASCPTTTFIGTIAYPPTIVSYPSLPAYYKGSHVEMHDGSYEIKEEMCAQEFFILFTLGSVVAQSTSCDDCNTIRSLVMAPSTPYKCYKISHTQNPSLRFGSQKPLLWNIESAKLSKKSNGGLIIPDNTIIVLANPNYIEKLETDTWKSLNNTYRLPKIVFKEGISEFAINDMADKALLASLDMNAFHRKPDVIKEIKAHQPSVIVSMVTG